VDNEDSEDKIQIPRGGSAGAKALSMASKCDLDHRINHQSRL